MRANYHSDAIQGTSNRVYRRWHFSQEALERRQANLMKQVLLARHVVIQRCLLNADGGRDFAGRGCGVTFVPEEIGSRVKQSVCGLASFLQIDALL